MDFRTRHLPLLLVLLGFIIPLQAQTTDQDESIGPKFRFYMSAGLSVQSLSGRIADHMEQSGFGDTDATFSTLFFIPIVTSTDYPEKDGSYGFAEVGMDVRLARSGWVGCRFGLDPAAGATGFKKVGSSSSGLLFFPLFYSSSDHGHIVHRSISTMYIGLTYTRALNDHFEVSLGPTLDFNTSYNGDIDLDKERKYNSIGGKFGIALQLNSWLGLTADWRWRKSVSFNAVYNSYENEAGQVITSVLPGETFPMHYFRLGFNIRSSNQPRSNPSDVK
ncbi:MAG: hypothetical protein K9I85_04305 [Saprospiraceae bacterium]|nr:hypothetical protein [Saprospiraceae bacterium]